MLVYGLLIWEGKLFQFHCLLSRKCE